MPFLVTDSIKKITIELGFPVVLFAVNPFIYDGYKTAQNKSGLYRAMKSLGMNYKFAVCAQPLKGELLLSNLSSAKRSAKICRRRKLLKRFTRHSKSRFANCTYKKLLTKLICVDCNP